MATEVFYGPYIVVRVRLEAVEERSCECEPAPTGKYCSQCGRAVRRGYVKTVTNHPLDALPDGFANYTERDEPRQHPTVRVFYFHGVNGLVDPSDRAVEYGYVNERERESQEAWMEQCAEHLVKAGFVPERRGGLLVYDA